MQAGPVQGRGIVQHLTRGPVAQDAPGVQKDDPPGVVRRQLHRVGDEEDGVPGAGQAVEQVHHGGDAGGIQAGRGFVEEEDLRPRRQGRGDGQALAVSARKREGVLRLQAIQANRSQGLGRPFGHLPGRASQVPGTEGDLVQDRLRKDLVVGVLEDVADLGPQPGGGPGAALTAADPDGPGRRVNEPREMSCQGRLA